ncbi:MAG: short chain dehydrogenase [Bacteroidetes bacterium]|nr:MAG: short chain dehydrogenase [Bacteroidota bacterium]
MFTNKTIIITGASSGIGKMLAIRLAEKRMKLVIAARDKQRLEDVAKVCRSKGSEAVVVVADVANKKACKKIVDEAVNTFGGIDILVNNAGITMWADFETVSNLEALEQIMQVNFFGSMYLTHFALPYLIQSKGQIVGVSSLTGKTGIPTRSIYAASKHAMAGFFDSLRIELKEKGVAVTMIYPGFVSSEVRERALNGEGIPLGKSPVMEKEVMTVEECVRLMLPVIEKRKRELVMTTRAKVGLWLKMFAPEITDNIALKAIKKGK